MCSSDLMGPQHKVGRSVRRYREIGSISSLDPKHVAVYTTAPVSDGEEPLIQIAAVTSFQNEAWRCGTLGAVMHAPQLYNIWILAQLQHGTGFIVQRFQRPPITWVAGNFNCDTEEIKFFSSERQPSLWANGQSQGIVICLQGDSISWS